MRGVIIFFMLGVFVESREDPINAIALIPHPICSFPVILPFLETSGSIRPQFACCVMPKQRTIEWDVGATY